MNFLTFEWDEDKAAINLRKHGVSFETATQVFLDPFILTRLDRIVDHEERWQAIGQVGGRLMLLVAYTTWEEDNHGAVIEVIRIISARDVERRERREYDAAR